MYFYLDRLDQSDPTHYPLKMGPLWDFDGAFVKEKDWSAQHLSNKLWMKYLWDYDEFTETYRRLWTELSGVLRDELEKTKTAWSEDYTAQLDLSRLMDGRRWDKVFGPVLENLAIYIDQSLAQIEWINEHIDEAGTVEQE